MTAGRPVAIGEWPAPPDGAEIADDPHALAVHFGDERGVHVYALADLDEPFWSASRWYRRGDAVVGLVGLPDGDGLACYAVATRDVPGTLELLRDLAPVLPPGLLVTGPVGTARAMREIRPLVWDGPHVRFELLDPGRLPAPDDRVEPVRRIDDLVALYAPDPDAAFFAPHMFGAGTFVGAYDDGRLVAAAGTHVVSTARSVAAIGAVYTAPDHRGRGLGTSTTATVARHLVERRVSTIGLNVSATNAAAIAIYRSIGFEPVHRYEEAELA